MRTGAAVPRDGGSPVPVEGGPGLLLALETSGRVGSAALAAPSSPGRGPLEVLARVLLAADEEHASLLVPRIGALLAGTGVGKEELTGILVGAGPGSFTGVRVAAATAKGLAFALGLPLWAFSSLAGAATEDGSGLREAPSWARAQGEDRPRRRAGNPKTPEQAAGDAAARSTGTLSGTSPTPELDEGRPRSVLFDARGDRVYAACFRPVGGPLETVVEPRAVTMDEVLDGLLPPGGLVMGDGAWRHRGILVDAGHTVLPPPFGHPTADGLIRLLSLDPDLPPLDDPGRWEPDYLRASGAERMWKTRKGMGA